jgi:hypothetical protein
LKSPKDLVKKALERLVSSLTSKEVKSNRIEMIEEALLLARLALGESDSMSEAEADDLVSNLETLGLQIVIDSMDRQDLVLYRAKVTFSDDAQNPACVIVTTHPVLGPLLDRHVEQMVERHHPDKPKTRYDVN